jgi:hypothetical protein
MGVPPPFDDAPDSQRQPLHDGSLNVRHVLRRVGILGRDVADYVAEVLAESSQVARTQCRVPDRPEPTEYFFDTLSERFGQTCRALNDLGDRLLSLGGTAPSVDGLLRTSFGS